MTLPAGFSYVDFDPAATTAPAAPKLPSGFSYVDFEPAGEKREIASPEFDALVSSIRSRESGGARTAVSPQGARGAMQIMPGTFKDYAQPGESFDNEDHREAAALRKLRDDWSFYGGDPYKTAAAYIGGRGAVREDGSVRDDVRDALGTTPVAYAEQVTGLSRRGGSNALRLNEADFAKYGKGYFGDQPAPAETKPKASGIARRAADFAGIDVARGVVSFGESVVGIADILTLGAVGAGLNAIGYDPKRTHQILSDAYSNERKAANQKVENAAGFVDTALEMIQNPSTIVGSAIQSLAGTAGIGAVGYRMADKAYKLAFEGAKHLGADAATKAGAEAVKALMPKLLTAVSATEGAQAAGSIAEQARQEGKPWAEYVLPAVAGGVGTAVIARGAGVIADKIGAGNIETAIATAGKGRPAGAAGNIVSRTAKGALTEGVLEEMPQSAQEQMFTNLATGRPPGDGVGAAAAQGLLTGAAMGGVNAALTRRPERRAPTSLEDAVAQAADPANASAPSEGDETLARMLAPAVQPAQRVQAIDAELAQIASQMQSASVDPGSDLGQRVQARIAALQDERANLSGEVEPSTVVPYAAPSQPTEAEQTAQHLAATERQYRDNQIADEVAARAVPYEPTSPPERPAAADAPLPPGALPERLELVPIDSGAPQGPSPDLPNLKAFNTPQAAALAAQRAMTDTGTPHDIVAHPTQPEALAIVPRGSATAAAVARAAAPRQAQQDAVRIGRLGGLVVDDADGLAASENEPIVRAFLLALPENERAAAVDGRGRVTDLGMRRFQNAVLARAYGANPVIDRIAAGRTAFSQRLTASLTRMAPIVSEIRDAVQQQAVADRDITDDIVSAVDELVRMKAEGRKAGAVLAQSGLFPEIPPETLALVEFLDENLDNPARLSEFLEAYLAELQRYGSEQQGTLFQAPGAPQKPALIQTAKEQIDEGQGGEVSERTPAEREDRFRARERTPEQAAASAAADARAAGETAVPGALAAGDERADQPGRGAVDQRGAGESQGEPAVELFSEKQATALIREAQAELESGAAGVSYRRLVDVLNEKGPIRREFVRALWPAYSNPEKSPPASDGWGQDIWREVVKGDFFARLNMPALSGLVRNFGKEQADATQGGEKQGGRQGKREGDGGGREARGREDRERPAEQPPARVPDRVRGGDAEGGPQPQTEEVAASKPVEKPEVEAEPDAATKIAEASREAAHSPDNDKPLPTAAQAEAGNYPLGHLRLFGLDISIENPKGSTRAGVDRDGKPWQVKMQAAYGYFRQTTARDGDHIDVYLTGNPTKSMPVFVFDQIDPATGKFDEHKIVLGAKTQGEAEALYDAHFSDKSGPRRRGAVKRLTLEKFKTWLKVGNHKRPIAYKEPKVSDAERAKLTNRPFALNDPRLKDETLRGYLEGVAAEAGWDERGGNALVDEVNRDRMPGSGDVIGRTQWMGQDWWQGRPADARIPGDVGGRLSREAARKALAGEPLRAVERRAVQAMLAEAERTGPAHRGADEDVSADRLKSEFGFRGVNFGREGWINQAERQAYLNHAYDGLMDLAEILNVPAKALSLNGTLGIAFGAQGRGGQAAAHFVPGVNEINLTKTMGASTLAHEWGHALDHYFAVQAGQSRTESPFLSESAPKPGAEIRPEIVDRFKQVVLAMRRRPMTSAESAMQEARYQQNVRSHLDHWIKFFRDEFERSKVDAETMATFEEIADRLKKGDMGEGYVRVQQMQLPQVIGALRLLLREKAPSRSVDIPDNWKAITNAASSMRFALNKKEASATHEAQMVETQYSRESAQADREKKGKAYWATPREMFARAFETYVSDRLETDARANTFLSDATQRAQAKNPQGGYASPYPRGEDRERIITAIDALTKEVKTKETDKGVALFSRRGNSGFVSAPDGSVDFGQITPEMGRAMRRQAGPIRLERGDDTFGERHIEVRHGESIRRLGYPDVASFVSEIARNIDQVWNPRVTRQLVAIHNAGGDRVMFIELRPARDAAGDYYTVRSAFPARPNSAKNKGWELLWEARAQASVDSGSSTQFAVSPSNTSGTATTIPSGQSRTGSVPPDDTPLSRAPAEFSSIWSGDVDGVPAVQHTVSIGGRVLGGVIMHERKGRPAVLYDIEATTKGRGYGQFVLRSVLDRVAPGEELYVVNLQPEAQDWWRRMGAQFIDNGGGNPDATITLEGHQVAIGEGGRAGAQGGSSEVRAGDEGESPTLRRGAQEEVTPQTPARAGVSVSALRSMIGDVASKIAHKPRGGILAVEFADELPERLRDYVLSQNGMDDVEGVYDPPRVDKNGRLIGGDAVYLIGRNIDSLDRAQFVLFHELYGHYGLRGVFGDALNAQLEGVALKNPNIRVQAAIKRAQFGYSAHLAIEEAMADLAGEGRTVTGLKQFMAAVQRALRSIGLNKAADFLEGLTDAEALSLLATARKWMEKGGPAHLYRPDVAPALQAKFSRRPPWIDQQSPETQEALRKAGVWYAPPTLKARVQAWAPDWAKRVRQGVVDQFDPIKEYDPRAYMLARMTKSADAALEGLLMQGTIYLDKDGAVDVNYEKGGFLGLLSKLNGEHDRFLSWVIGNRAEQLAKPTAAFPQGREHNFSAQDIARLKALNQGKMADGRSRGAVFDQALADLNRYNNAVLDVAERAGLIDGASRKIWQSQFYVPFYRYIEEEESTKGPVNPSGLVKQYAFKKLKGGAQELGDPVENMLRNWSHLISASLKNQAASESIKAAVRLGAAQQTASDTKGAVYVVENGKNVYYAIDDPFLLDALRSIGFLGFHGPAMKVMQSFKRLLTLGVTISPTFRIRNVIRDSLSMIGANPASYNVLNNVLTGWKGTKEGSADFAHILAGGGVMRYGSWLEGDRAPHVKRLIESGIDDKTILNTPEKMRAAMRKAWDWWQHVGDRAENVNRVALYKKLRSEGKSHLEASYAARDVMDFSMGGTWAAIRFLSQTVPFFNARLQGGYKLGRGMMEDPRRFSAVLGATALASIALMLAYEDDDDWKQREDWDRETFWWFKVGDTAYRIPKPFEIGALATIAERALEAMLSDELTGKQFAQRVWAILMEQMSMNPTPQLFKPAIEVWANRDSFTDRPIETMGMEKLSTSERSAPYTSGVAQVVGKAGVLSPVQIDHLVRAYFGWLGAQAVATADFAVRPAIDAPDRPARRMDDYWVVGDFAKELPAYQSKYVTRLYDQAKKVQEAMADVRHYREIGEIEKANEIAEDNKDEIQLYRIYTSAQRRLAEVNKRIRLVQRLEDLSAEEKREQLDMLYEQRNRIAKLTAERARERAKETQE